MKTKDIEPNQQYVADIDYTRGIKVTALEVGLETKSGYSRRTVMKNGVRIRLEQDVSIVGIKHATGDELVVPSREIREPWTAQHEAAAKAAAASEERGARIVERLIAAGVPAEQGRWIRPDGTVAVRVDHVVMDYDTIEKLLDRPDVSLTYTCPECGAEVDTRVAEAI